MPSRLGFGTSGIMGSAFTSSGRLRLLEAAWDEGIRHFDTAPLYGQGEAEVLLGRFARGRRDTVTITTKFGLVPRSFPSLIRPLIPWARAVNRRLLLPLRQAKALAAPQLRKSGTELGLQRTPGQPARSGPAEPAAPEPPAPSTGTTDPPPVPYTPAALREQLLGSLRKLQTDYIDYYLLHECQAHYLNQPFLDCLDQLVREGKIRHYGLGSGRWQSRCILERYPCQDWVIQIPDGLGDSDTQWYVERSAGPLFTHSSLRLSLALDRITKQDLTDRWSALTNQDPQDPALLGDMLLALALAKNPTGCVIFSSSRAERIRANAALLCSAETLAAAAESWLQAVATANSAPSS